jgi:hypothetical protein
MTLLEIQRESLSLIEIGEENISRCVAVALPGARVFYLGNDATVTKVTIGNDGSIKYDLNVWFGCYAYNVDQLDVTSHCLDLHKWVYYRMPK